MSTSQGPNSRKLLLILLALIFFSRLIFAVMIWKVEGTVGFHSPDTITYTAPAESLLHGSYSRAGLPEIFRTPGYPFLLLPALLLGHLEAIAILENILLATFSAWAIWEIARELFTELRAAVWAVVLYSIEPMSLLQAEKVLTETAFTAALLLMIWMMVRFLRGAGYASLVFSALSLGCATYLRPVSLYLGFWLLPVLFLFPRSLPLRRRAASAILFPILLGLTLAPWIIRNTRVADYRGFSATSDIDLYFYPAAAVLAKMENKPFLQQQREMGWDNREVYLQNHPEQRDWSQGRIARFCSTEARRIISSHVLLYSGIHAKGCMMTLFNPGATELLRDVGAYPVLSSPLPEKMDQGLVSAMVWLIRTYPLLALLIPIMAIQLLFYYVFAVAGLRHIALDVRLLFVMIVVYFVAISGIPGAVSRWRAPFMPIICICAGVAIAKWRARKQFAASNTA